MCNALLGGRRPAQTGKIYVFAMTSKTRQTEEAAKEENSCSARDNEEITYIFVAHRLRVGAGTSSAARRIERMTTLWTKLPLGVSLGLANVVY